MAVVVSACNTVELIRRAISDLKQQNFLDPLTFSFLYAADFVDRFEHQIIPALEAGQLVIAEQYVYTVFGRAILRGIAPEWIANIFDFALVPAKTFYLDLPVESLLERIHWKTRQERFFDYYEAGMEQEPFQAGKKTRSSSTSAVSSSSTREMAKAHGMETIDAMAPIHRQQKTLRAKIDTLLATHRKGMDLTGGIR
ncbi:MAG: Thymidylate kinase [Leptospirillum sp. Group IV 'UBA BS']|nr:MAG: Thymidylate kinase [Leptospirillum sp. Group IV 'UBA BS']